MPEKVTRHEQAMVSEMTMERTKGGTGVGMNIFLKLQVTKDAVFMSDAVSPKTPHESYGGSNPYGVLDTIQRLIDEARRRLDEQNVTVAKKSRAAYREIEERVKRGELE